MTSSVASNQEIAPTRADILSRLKPLPWRIVLPIIAIVMVGVVGHAASALKPVIIQAFVQSIGYTKPVAGYLLTLELISTSVGTVFAAAFPMALRARKYLFVAFLIMMLANLASIPFRTDVGIELYALRCLSGLGAGFGLGRLAILIALTGHPGKTAGIYSVTTQLYGAAAAFAMPLLDSVLGANTIFIVMAGTVPLALFLIGWLPQQHKAIDKKEMAGGERRSLAMNDKVVLAITFAVFYLGVGTFWPFIAILGETANVSKSQASMILGWAAIASAVGSFASILAGDRKGSAPVITVFFVGLCLSIVLQMIAPTSFVVFVGSALFFSLAYWVINPMILGFLSKLDMTGQMNGIYYIAAVAGIGLGPALAGWILAHQPDRATAAALLRAASVFFLATSSAVMTYYAYRARRFQQ